MCPFFDCYLKDLNQMKRNCSEVYLIVDLFDLLIIDDELQLHFQSILIYYVNYLEDVSHQFYDLYYPTFVHTL